MLPRHREDAVNLLVLSQGILFSFFFLIVLALFFFGKEILSLLGNERIHNELWFIPFGVMMFGIRETLACWFAREKKFFLLAFGQVLTSSTTACIKILAGLLVGSTSIWLITGNILGLVIPSIIMLILLVKDSWHLKQSIQMSRVTQNAKDYIKFPRYQLSTSFLNTFSQNIPVFMFGFLFSTEIVGYYGFAVSITKKPIQLVSRSLSKVFLQKATETNARLGNLQQQLKKATLGLFLAGIIPFTILAVFGQPLFQIIFGAKWETAGLFCQIMCPWFLLMFINTPATQIIIVKQQLRFNLIFTVVQIILRTASIGLACVYSNEAWVAVALFSGVSCLMNLYYIRFAFLCLNK